MNWLGGAGWGSRHSCAGEAGRTGTLRNARVFRAAPRNGKPLFRRCEILPIAGAQCRGLLP
jgi:hypothetical protein